MPLINMNPYRVSQSLASGYELLFTNSSATGSRASAPVHSIDVSKNQFDVKILSVPGSVYQSQYSPDGNFLVLSGANAPYFEFYRRTGDGEFTQGTLTNMPSGTPANRAISFSDDSTMMCLHGGGSLSVYKRNEDSSEYNFVSTVAVGGTCGCVSKSGQYYAVNSGNFLYIYKWNPATLKFVYITTAAYETTAVGGIEWIDWTKDDTHIFMSNTNASNAFFIWSRNAEVFTRVRTVAISGGLRKFAVSPDQQHIAAYPAAANVAKLIIMKWDGASGITMLNIPALSVVSTGVSYSPDSNYLAIGLSNGSEVAGYQGRLLVRTGDAYQLVPNRNLQTNTAFGAKPNFRPVLS